MTIKNQLKYLWYRLQWQLVERFDWTPKHPLHVDIELTNQCNLQCTMCPQGDPNWQPKKGMMETKSAKKYIDQCAELGVYSIKLQFRGESSLHPDLPEIIRYAKSKGILEVQLNTNGIPYTAEKVAQIVSAGLDRLIVSVDGATHETYAKIRVGGKLSKVIQNVHRFQTEKMRQKTDTPKIRVQMTQQDDNDNEVKEFTQVWAKMADELIIKPVRSRNTGERKRCPQPQQRLVVGWNGYIYGCCNAWNEESKVGTTVLSLQENWERPFFQNLRYSAKKPGHYEPCRSCQVRASYK